MKQYKAVFIDWDDTIGDFIGAAKLALQEMYEKYNLSDYFASLEEFVSLYKPHNLELWDKYGKDLVTKEYLLQGVGDIQKHFIACGVTVLVVADVQLVYVNVNAGKIQRLFLIDCFNITLVRHSAERTRERVGG